MDGSAYLFILCPQNGVFRGKTGHRMDGSAHLFILCPQNGGFRAKTGHRMDGSAHLFILCPQNGVFRGKTGHRMDGSAHLFILCPQNTGFHAKTGHRMDDEAVSFILWHKNESAEKHSDDSSGGGRYGGVFLGSAWTGMYGGFSAALSGPAVRRGYSRTAAGATQRSPAGGREITPSQTLSRTPSCNCQKINIYRLFSALPGNNRIFKEVFLGPGREKTSPSLPGWPQNGWECSFVHSVSTKHGFSGKIWPQNGWRGRFIHSVAQK